MEKKKEYYTNSNKRNACAKGSTWLECHIECGHHVDLFEKNFLHI